MYYILTYIIRKNDIKRVVVFNFLATLVINGCLRETIDFFRLT